MVQIEQYENCEDDCAGSKQHESRLNNDYDIPWIVFIYEDQVCVLLNNDSSTNVSVNIWAEDAEGNGPLTNPDYWVPVSANTSTCVYIWEFGYHADGVSKLDKFVLHTALYNDDNENEGIEIFIKIFSGA